MSRNIKFLIIGLIITTTASVGYYWTKHHASTQQAKIYSTQAANMLAMPDQERQMLFDNMASSRMSFPTAEEASRNLPFAFKIPDEKLTGKPTRFYVSKNDNIKDRLLFVHYTSGVNGIVFSAILEPTKPDFTEHVNRLTEEIHSGITFGDKVPKLIDINGLPAFAAEPGYNLIEGDKIPRFGIVEWWDNGVVYTIYGTRGPEGTSLEDLTEIARSVIESEEIIPPGMQLTPEDPDRNSVVKPTIQPEDMENNKVEQEEYE